MKKIIYTITIITLFLFGVGTVAAEDIASCQYSYESNGKTTPVTYTVYTEQSGFIFKSTKTKLRKTYSGSEEALYYEKNKDSKGEAASLYIPIIYGFSDSDFIKKVYTEGTVFDCPAIDFATFQNFENPENTYAVIELTSSVSEPCAGIDESGYTCKAQTGAAGSLSILSDNVTKSDNIVVYCTNSYTDSDLGKVVAETFTDGEENYFRLYDDSGNILGTTTSASWFNIGEKWYSSPNISSLYSDECNPSDLILNSNVDRGEQLGNDYDHKVETQEENTSPIESTNGATIALLQRLYRIVKIAIPVLIVILSIIDFLKVVLLSDEKDYKNAWNKFVKRIVIGIIFFIVPVLVDLIINISGIETEQSFLEIFK